MTPEIIWTLVILVLKIFTIRCEKINEPTLKPIDPFSVSADAQILREELKKSIKSVDRDKITKIIFHRIYDQRQQIEDFYNNNLCSTFQYYFPWSGTYSSPMWDQGCPLNAGLPVISKDSMKNLYEITLVSGEAILARNIHEAILDKWKEKGAIEEIVCANDKEMKDRINQSYQGAYQDTVENQMATFRKDDKDYQHVMQQYCWKGLCQDKKIKPEDAEKEAKALRAIDPDKDKKKFKKKLDELLDKHCEPDMKLIFEKYRQDKNGIDDAINKAFDVERQKTAYNRLVRYIESPCQFYADELHAAVDGAGTDIDKINRIIMTRCERDLGCILNKYKDIHKETFTNRLKTDVLTEPRYLESIRYLCGKT